MTPIKTRAIKIIVAGLALAVAAGAATLATSGKDWLLTITFVGWCIAAFGVGVLYREIVRDARERRGKQRP